MTTMAALLAFVCFQNPVFAGNLDTEASSLKWLGEKITGKHFGTLTFADGELTQKDGEWTGGNFTVDMTSMSVDDIAGSGAKKLLGHLKSSDFFHVESHPTATLNITSIKGNTVNANLTIKGKTNPIRFTYKKQGKAFVGTMTFDRSLFDVKYRSKSFFPDIGDKIIYNDVSVDFTVQSK
jgi:polyisoprenoid-binding protein YceI